jgi:hypothetical protein
MVDEQPGSTLSCFDVALSALGQSVLEPFWIMVEPDLSSSFDFDFKGVTFESSSLNWYAWFAVSKQWNPVKVVARPKVCAFDFDAVYFKTTCVRIASLCV